MCGRGISKGMNGEGGGQKSMRGWKVVQQLDNSDCLMRILRDRKWCT